MFLKELFTLSESVSFDLGKKSSIDLGKLDAETASELKKNPKLIGKFDFTDEEGKFKWKSTSNVIDKKVNFETCSHLAAKAYRQINDTAYARLICTRAIIIADDE